MAPKRIIRTAPVEMHQIPPGTIAYDGNEDFVDETGEFDHTVPGVLYASEMIPVFADDPEGNRVKVSEETVLIPVHASVKAHHTFGGWQVVGKPLPEE